MLAISVAPSSDDSCFTTESVDDEEAGDISDASSARPASDQPSNAAVGASENGPSSASPPTEIAVADDVENIGNIPSLSDATAGRSAPDPCIDDDTTIPRGRSICHPLLKQNKLVFLSLDIETGGENCGIVQLSAEIVRLELNREEGKTAHDTLANVVRDGTLYHEHDNPGGGEFNKYVNPGEDAEWSRAATEITGLSETDARITSAWEIGPVWNSFCLWIKQNIAEDEHGVIVAYNGAGSDMKWIWRLTQAPYAPHEMPPRLDYYMDPYISESFAGRWTG